MTISDEILILANRIANKGNKPTVALIKTKLKTKVSLPVIISVLKTWQHDPSFITLANENTDTINAENATTSVNDDSVEYFLRQDLTDIKAEIRELKTLIQYLINQQTK